MDGKGALLWCVIFIVEEVYVLFHPNGLPWRQLTLSKISAPKSISRCITVHGKSRESVLARLYERIDAIGYELQIFNDRFFDGNTI